MKLFHKRLLILFSVALNIGFVIMAIVMMLHSPTASQHRSYQAILDIVRQLNLPADQEHTLVETIRQFRTTVEHHNQDLKKARSDVVRLLSVSGPVDRDQLQRLTAAIATEENMKNEAFEAHFIDIRNQLGNDKGAQFFTLLLAHIKAENQSHHR